MPSVLTRFSRVALASVLGATLAFSPVLAPLTTMGQAPAGQALARGAPESFAPLVERVLDAVVNISASQTVENRGVPLPDVPPGSPFQDFFNDFFNRRGEGQPNRPNQGPGQQRRSNSLGSGFVIDPSGIVITNNHVIGEANDITVNFNDGSKLKAEVVGRDPKTDIAVLRVRPERPLKAVRFGDDTRARVGDWVVAIGNPFGFDSSVSAGILSARNRRIGSGPYDNFIQTDAAINRGNSGGPLFNMDGDVIGINTAIISPSGGSIGIGFAVPASLAMPVIDQLRQFGETRRGWLGVNIQEVDEGIAESLNLGSRRGAMVSGVQDNGPAKGAGIQTGDVIVRFDGQDVRDSRDLPRIVANTPVGKSVPVTVVRRGQEQVISVTLGRLEQGELQASAARPNGQRAPEAAAPVRSILGLDLAPMNDDTRRRFSIKEGVRGVVITRVDPNSNAAQKRISAGDTIVEVGQEPVASPADIQTRVERLRRENRRSALLLLANAQGDLRFVAVTLD
jgi:serine protease Do